MGRPVRGQSGMDVMTDAKGFVVSLLDTTHDSLQTCLRRTYTPADDYWEAVKHHSCDQGVNGRMA